MLVRKFAYFVEGYTEQEFLKTYLVNIFKKNELALDIHSVKGGSCVAISYTTISSIPSTEETKYYFMIFNCNGDNAIKSYIKSRRQGLINAGYEKIIGLRDVYPDVKKEEIQKLREGLYYQMPQADLPTKFILSLMEIEAWFLSEEIHFQNIDPQISIDVIIRETGFDPCNHLSEQIEEPANTLKTIYQIAGKSYKKEQKIIDRTIAALDMDNLYLNCQNRNSSLKELIDEIDSIFI